MVLMVGLAKERMKGMNKDKYNSEGYADPTAYAGMREVIIQEGHEADRRAFDLIRVLKFIVGLAGFELIERVQLKDTKTGKEYR